MFQTGMYTLGVKSPLDLLCCLLHLPSKAWITARWALRAPYKIPDYLNVKDSREAVLPRARPGNCCTGAAYTESLCQWESYSLQLSSFCCRSGLLGQQGGVSVHGTQWGNGAVTGAGTLDQIRYLDIMLGIQVPMAQSPWRTHGVDKPTKTLSSTCYENHQHFLVVENQARTRGK